MGAHRHAAPGWVAGVWLGGRRVMAATRQGIRSIVREESRARRTITLALPARAELLSHVPWEDGSGLVVDVVGQAT